MKLKCTCGNDRVICVDCMKNFIEDIEDKQEHIEYIEKSLMDLLCYIHRDGGHYIAKYGLKKAVNDAIDKVCRLIHDM